MEFMSIINSFGSIPLLVLLIVIFILLLREVKKDNRDTRNSLDGFRNAIEKQIKEHKLSTEKLIDNQNTAIEKMEERLRVIEQDYADKAYVQEINSNWRTEIRRIDEKLDKILMGNSR